MDFVIFKIMFKAPFLIANWKMNFGIKQAVQTTADLVVGIREISLKGQLVICPSYPSLLSVKQTIGDASLSLGAQDVSGQDRGAFTGEVASWMLKEIGAEYVIIGHSERKKYCKETDDAVNKKVKNALKEGVTPIVCVGETFEERQENREDHVVLRQVQSALEGVEVNPIHPIIIAYEPVWVIGTGQAIQPKDAEYMHTLIRRALIDLYPVSVVDHHTAVVYGGSVDEHNVEEFLTCQHIQGFLVGSASLKSDQFLEIIKKVLSQ